MKRTDSTDGRADRSRILLIDSHGPSLKRAADALEEAGFSVTTVSSPVDVVGEDEYDVLIPAASDEAAFEAVVEAARHSIDDVDVPVVLILPKNVLDAKEVKKTTGADAVLVRPVSGASLVAVTEGFSRVRRLEKKLTERERQLEQALTEGGRIDPHTGFYDFESFKSILATEVKRARRYRYPFSIAIATLDRLAEIRDRFGEETARVLEGGLRLAISKSLRDLDLPVAYGSGQVLVVMPHTPRKGTRAMTDRLKRSIESTLMEGPEGSIGTTVSIGIASYDGDGEVSFGSLAREAAEALKIAVARGGNRVAEVPITRRRARREGEVTEV